MTLDELVARYFALMQSRPTFEDLTRFAVTIPPHLQLPFIGWIRTRADTLEAMGFGSSDRLLN